MQNRLIAFGNAAGWLAVLLIIIGQFGRWYALADIPNILMPIWLSVCVAALLLTSAAARHATGKRRLFALVLALGVGSYQLQGSVLMRSSAVPGSQSLKIISFNLWSANPHPAETLRWLAQQDADLLVLLEAKGAMAGIPRALAIHYPYQQTCNRAPICSTVILSRIAPDDMQPLAGGDAENRRALSAALMRFTRLPGAPIIIGVHLSHQFPLGAQAYEYAKLSKILAYYGSEHVIIAGDFNTSRANFALSKFLDQHGLMIADPARPTWPVFDYFPAIFDLDHIIVSKDWAMSSAQRGPRMASDHYPLLATFSPVTAAKAQIKL